MRAKLSLKILLILIILPVSLYAQKLPFWYTGSLLSNPGQTMPEGHWNFEPYLYTYDIYGIYDKNWKYQKIPFTRIYSVNPIISYGIIEGLDFQGSFFFNRIDSLGQHSEGFSDPNIALGYQAIKKHPYLPNLRLTLVEIFPIGKYDNLDPIKLGTDANGGGVYQTTIGLNFQDKYYIGNSEHAFRYRFNISYTLAMWGKLNGHSIYGGNQNTHGQIHPGNLFQMIYALEYQITKQLVGVFEIYGTHRTKTSFKGTRGLDPILGLPASIGTGEQVNISIAPAFEYNFTEDLGLVTGVWFSVLGKNSSAFSSIMLAVNYYM